MFLESLEKKRERKRERESKSKREREREKECNKYKTFNININALHEKRVLLKAHRLPHVGTLSKTRSINKLIVS